LNNLFVGRQANRINQSTEHNVMPCFGNSIIFFNIFFFISSGIITTQLHIGVIQYSMLFRTQNDRKIIYTNFIVTLTSPKQVQGQPPAPAPDHSIKSSSSQCMDDDGGIEDDENKAAPALAPAGAGAGTDADAPAPAKAAAPSPGKAARV
jgi:hypothetical protein